ncbi:MAG: cytochrome b/b6 domain-containing protein [Eggerthellaceae bacterium]|nr:cytochrome b/b6 domain-containing protein [Eggerthellaceae bacterium]
MKRSTYILIICMAAFFMVVFFPSLTTIAVHEWLGLVILPIFVIHIVINSGKPASLAVSLFRGKSGRRSLSIIFRIAVDIGILVCLVLCEFSGLMISATVLPAFGVYVPDGYYAWTPVHALSATLLLAFLIVHVALQRPAIVQAVKNFRKKSGKSLNPDRSSEAATPSETKAPGSKG